MPKVDRTVFAWSGFTGGVGPYTIIKFDAGYSDTDVGPRQVYNPAVGGVKDYNSSDIVVKGSDGIYYGFSLKKKGSSKDADPTLINKPITGRKSLLKPIVGTDYETIENAKEKFFTQMIK